MSTLIIRDDARLAVDFTAEAAAIKDAALEKAALIGRVSSPVENAAAVEAQMECQRVLKLAEEARVACKQPVLEFGRRIDGKAKEFSAELSAELLRLSRLVGDFQALEMAKQRAAEAQRVKELAEIERARQAELAAASSHKELEAVQEKFNQQAAELPVTVHPVRATGQIVKEDWDITVVDVHALYRSHPVCVKLEPMLSEIRALLGVGITPQGVRAQKVVKSAVRVKPEQRAIAV